MFLNCSRKSKSRTAAQHAAYPSGFASSTIFRVLDTVAGDFWRKAVENHRSTTAEATDFMPFFWTASIRAFQNSEVPILAAVLQSTSLLRRSGALTPSHMP